jgi:hypothetical protein
MPETTLRRSSDEVARLGQEIFERRVQPHLKPEDDGKYVAIDIASEDHEVDTNDWQAVMRLSERHRGGQVWLLRVGKSVRMGYRMMFPQ